MATTATRSIGSRHSADDRRGNPRTSPFRAEAQTSRVLAAVAMVQKRTREIADLEAALATEVLKPGERRRLQMRLSASRNNLESWIEYLGDDSPIEKKAVITP